MLTQSVALCWFVQILCGIYKRERERGKDNNLINIITAARQNETRFGQQVAKNWEEILLENRQSFYRFAQMLHCSLNSTAQWPVCRTMYVGERENFNTTQQYQFRAIFVSKH